MKRIFALLSMLFTVAAFGQSSPGLVYKQVPSAAQWNSYFAAKVDYVVGGLPVSQGGTGATNATQARLNLGIAGAADLLTALPAAATNKLYGGSGTAGLAHVVTVGSGLQLLGGVLSSTVSGAGTVTSFAVTSGNGFFGSVATATSTPNLTIGTSVSGILKGNGTAISAASPADLFTGLGLTSGVSNQIFTFTAAPNNTSGTPATLVIQNNSPGMSSSVNPVTGSGGDWHNFAQININGSYVYPAVDMNQGFGGFLNFNTRNLAGTTIQGAFVNGGLIGTTPGSERGDLDLGIYGHRIGCVDGACGGNLPRLLALREDAGQLALISDSDGEWNLGNNGARFGKGFFKDVVQASAIDFRFTPTSPWAFAIGNPSSMLDTNPHSTITGYLKMLINNTTVYLPMYQ